MKISGEVNAIARHYIILDIMSLLVPLSLIDLIRVRFIDGHPADTLGSSLPLRVKSTR
jgi:hypothetical protein